MPTVTTDLQNESDLPFKGELGSIAVKKNVVFSTGIVADSFDVEYSIYGSLTSPVVVVLGGITANRYVLDTQESLFGSATGNDKELHHQGWWAELAGINKAINTRNYCVVSFNYVSRVKTKTAAGQNSEHNLTPSDQALVLKCLLKALQVEQPITIIGSSYGGMVGLSFAEIFKTDITQLVCISASDRSTHTARAIRAIQKSIFELADNSIQQHQALSLARQLSVLFYRTDEIFDAQFVEPVIHPSIGKVNDFDQTIYSYLNHQGQKFANKTSIPNYAALLDSIDAHNVQAEKIVCDSHFIAVPTDRLVSYESMRRLAQKVKGKSEFYRLESIYGHDAFLKEFEQLSNLLKKILGESDESSTSNTSC